MSDSLNAMHRDSSYPCRHRVWYRQLLGIAGYD
jgi:hypothetical protein